MDIKISSQTKNPFLQRDELVLTIDSETAPGFKDINEFLKKPEQQVVIKQIKSNFGKHSFNAYVMIYDSEDAKNKIQTLSKKQKEKLEKQAQEQAQKEQEQKQQEQAEEQKPDENKEQTQEPEQQKTKQESKQEQPQQEQDDKEENKTKENKEEKSE